VRPAKLIPICFFTILTLACGKDSPEPPGVTPGPPENVTGTERLGWTQTASDAGELSTIRYAIYIDGARTELSGASCQPPSSPTSAAFECSAPLPSIPAGAHTLELAAFVVDGSVLESARSAPLQVNKTTAASAPVPASAWTSGITFNTVDGLRLRIDRVAEGLVNPTGVAFLPDGRTFIAEESGRVRVLTRDGRLAAAPALSLRRGQDTGARLLAIAADSSAGDTAYLYAVYVTESRAEPAFTLARFRESSNTLFAQTVLRDAVPASATQPAAAIRVGADGKLLAAFDDGGDPRRAGDMASPNGKILRLNADGTTPDDQAGLTPVYSSDLHSPRGVDARPGSNVIWVADRVSDASAELRAVGPADGPRKRGVTLASYTLPRGTWPASLAVYRGNLMQAFRNDLLIASEQGRHLLRVRLDAADQTKVASTERLLLNAIGGLRVVAVNPDGVIYLATADALATVTPVQ
jgi:aldose sugar dehydrogenase